VGRYGQILVVVVLMVAGQLLFRKSAVTAPPLSTLKGLAVLGTNPFFLLALCLYGVATLLWVSALQYIPLSRAYAFMALSFLVVPIAAVVLYGEAFTAKLAIGLCLVTAGLILIGVGG
jgi:undecaprenyl phosphate-alpha-L-ara4N flippase subunit ArnE